MKLLYSERDPAGAIVRAAHGGDAAMIAAHHVATFERGWDQAFVRDLLHSDSGFGFLIHAKDDDTTIGFALARQVGDDCEILSLAVRDSNRRQGLASALLLHLVQHAQDSDISRIFLEVASDNTPAIALYKRSGFATAGLREGYYARENGTACDALVLTLALDGRRS